MNKEAVVLFPSLGMGHLIPMVELAKLLTHNNFAVTILVAESPFPVSSAMDPFISRISTAYPSISFRRLPKLSLPSDRPFPVFQLLPLTNPLLLQFLKSFSETSTVRAIVLDMFCTAALDVASELGLPAYFFFASSASILAAFLYVPALQSQINGSFGDLGDAPLPFPGLPPIPASHLPDHLQDREGERNKDLMFHFERLPKGNGIILNTFEQLEPRAVQALVDGLCVGPGSRMPPIYCVGPLVGREGDEGEKHECLKWLDAQPKGSVVFLCFGSRGSFCAGQLKEIAIGLERSGQRFLWVVRSPPIDEVNKRFGPLAEPDLRVVLPVGFLERTEGRGMVVKLWAPQAAVLGHGSVGGFVSHCGWNSVLEALTAGVPMIAWPLYAEQKMNKVFLVEEAKLAVEMKGYDKEMVSAEEVETKVIWLMESEGGRELKDRAAAMKESAVAALKDGGSSQRNSAELVTALNRGFWAGEKLRIQLSKSWIGRWRDHCEQLTVNKKFLANFGIKLVFCYPR